MLFSQTISLIFLLAPSVLAEKYDKITPDFVKTVTSLKFGVDCGTHVYTDLQLKKLAFSSLRTERLVKYCTLKSGCFKKLDYRKKYMSYVQNSYFPIESYYIRVRSTGGILKGRFAKNNIIVVANDGTIQGVLTTKDKAWVNCPNREKVGTISEAQRLDLLKTEQKIKSQSSAKPADGVKIAQTAEMAKIYPAESDEKSSVPRGPSSPRGASSPRAAEKSAQDNVPTDPSTSGSNE